MSNLNTPSKLAPLDMAEIANIGLCDLALERALSRTRSLPGLVCFYGPSGFGKTMAAAWVANSRRAYYVQAKSLWNRKHTLKSILTEMGIKPAGTIPEMADQIAEELAASGRPLIIDEMDHLVSAGSVELVRDLYESSQAAILLIGEEMLPTKLKKYERFHGRVLSWVPAQPVTLLDAQKLVQVYSPQVVIADQFLRQHPRQLMQRGLARPVGIGLFAHGADARHRADVDHSRRIFRAGRAAQQRQQLLDAGKHRGDIELHDLFPAGHRIAFQRCAPTGAGVVHQDIQPRAEFAERLRQAPGTGFAGKVGRDRLAIAVGREVCGGVGAGLCVTCADEDAGAGFEKTLGDQDRKSVV